MSDDDPRNFKIHRNRRGWPRWYQRYLEAWWIIRGTWSLHRAWQDGVLYALGYRYLGPAEWRPNLVDRQNLTESEDCVAELEATLSEAHTTAEIYREAIATLQGRIERLRTLLQSQLDAGTWRHHPMTKMEVEAVMRETGND